MATSFSRWFVLPALFGVTLVLACAPQDDTPALSGVEGLVAPMAKQVGCDMGSMSRDARAYFPGKGKGSILDQAQLLVGLLAEDCRADNRVAYTGHWFELAALVQGVLEDGGGGDAEAGGRFLATSVGVRTASGDLAFAPCGGAADCLPWDGFPSSVPDFARVLASPDGAWSVVTTGTEATCSSFVTPCDGWDAALLGDAWGVEPSVDWESALHGRTSLVFGHPLDAPSPTGEATLVTELPAYRWLLIPDPDEFAVDLTPPAVLEVGLCSTVPTEIEELLVQKGRTILTEAVIDWCDSQVPSLAWSESSRLDRLVAFLSPLPAPLVATAALRGGSPGGSAGGFTDFYAVDLPRAALLVLSGQPSDAMVGQVITGPGGAALSIAGITSSVGSPLENALIHVQIIGNGGLIPSGNEVAGAGLTCANFACTGRTQADEDPVPGTLFLPLVFTKPGQYSMCFTATLPPLQFGAQICTGKFNIRP